MAILGKLKSGTNRGKQSCGTNHTDRKDTLRNETGSEPHPTWQSFKGSARALVNSLKDTVIILNSQIARQGEGETSVTFEHSERVLNPQRIVRYYPTPGFVPIIPLSARSHNGNAFPKHPPAQIGKHVPSSTISSEKHDSHSSQSPESQSKNFFHRYKWIKFLGSGGNGQVDLYEDQSKQGTLVAVKELRISSSSISQEVSITSGIGVHENIVRFFECCDHPTDPRKGLLVMEYCHGDLEQWKSNCKGDVPEAFLWKVFKQMSAALAHIHSHGIVHGDFKHLNVLYLDLPGKKWPILKLADFGASVAYPEPNIPRAHLATFGWAPPEAEIRYGPELDVWGLGSLIHWLALGCRPVRRIYIGLEDPDSLQETNRWFYHTAQKRIPDGVYDHKGYIDFCVYNAEHPYSLKRIDVKNNYAKVVRSKLLNYFMLRTLDVKYYHRISSHELNRIMEILEPFVQDVLSRNLEAELNQFNDGHDQDWAEIQEISDSQVILQIFMRTRKWYVDFAKPLMKVMDGKDFATAHSILRRPMLRGPQIVPGISGDILLRKSPIARKPLPHPEKPNSAYPVDASQPIRAPGARTRAQAFLTQPNPFA